MHEDLVNLGWSEDHLSRIRTTVAEEAQRARVLAQALPLSGPEDGSTIEVPSYTLGNQGNPLNPPPASRLIVNSQPNLPIATIAINVQLRSHEIADPSLNAALVQFRRAANYIARIEDAFIVNGRPGPNLPPPVGLAGIPPVFTIQGVAGAPGLIPTVNPPVPVLLTSPGLVNAVIQAINILDGAGHGGPYACLLGQQLFTLATTPNPSFVMARDRILPFLQGPLLRSSAFVGTQGAVVSLSGNPIEIIVASDIGVRYLQTSVEPRYIFRVSERVALRIKEAEAIVHLI